MEEESGTGLQGADEGSGTALIKYERGLPFPKVLKATLVRFLPGSVVTLIAGLLVLGGNLTSMDLLGVVAGSAAFLSLGYGVGLEALRRWLYPDADVDGRRSFVAGLVAPLGAFIAGVLAGPMSTVGVLGFLFLPAFIIALLMFFAWLTPTPEEMRGPEYEDSLNSA